MENQDKETDKILGMNRTMFFVIVILICVLSLSIGIYAQVFYRYSETDPFILGIGVGKSQDAVEITKLKNEFNTMFTNNIEGTSTISNINKKDKNKDLVYISETMTEQDEDLYNISVNIPAININIAEAEKINNQIKDRYLNKVESIIEEAKEYTDYSVTFKAYVNGELLSLIIKETIREGRTVQSAKINTYNYSLSGNRQVSIQDVINSKGYKNEDLQKEIDAEMKELNTKDEELKNQYTEVKLRDLSSSIYKIENTENFIVNQDGYLYLIYAYGNTENTNKMDIIIFE